MALIDEFRHYELKTNEQVQKYHNQKNSFGHTAIVNFEKEGPMTLKKDYSIAKTDSLVFGSIVDTLVTRPLSVHDEFIVDQSESLTPSDKKLIDYVISKIENTNKLEEWLSDDDKIIKYLDTCGYYVSKKKSDRLQKAKELKKSFETYILGKDKQIISKDMYSSALRTAQSVCNSPISKWIFDNPDNVLFQVACLTEFDDFGIIIKSLFDILYFDKENKVVYPIDLKTTSSPVTSFVSQSFYKYRYFRQAELYMYILEKALKRFDANDWKINNFMFLVVNKDSLSPMLYEFPIVIKDNKLKISKNAFVPRFDAVIKDMWWHILTGQYEYPKEIYVKIKNQQHPVISILDEEDDTTNYEDLDYLT